MRQVVVSASGGPEVLTFTKRGMPSPGPGEVQIAQEAVGVNFVDLNHRAGTPYPIAPPFVPGIEAVGHVTMLGTGVAESWLGAYVGYAGPMPGAYASHAVIAAGDLVRIDPAVGPETAAALLMQGMTAWYLANRVTDIRAGDATLVHAAATGVGQHLARLLRAKGALVIGTSRHAHGVASMQASGVDHALQITDPADLPALVANALGQRHGVAVAFDSLGGFYSLPTLRTLRAKGHFISYGLAAGPIPPLAIAALSGFFNDGLAGSLKVQWASLGDYLDSPDLRQQAADAVFRGLASGDLVAPSIRTFPLDQAPEAHAWMQEAGRSGKAVLIP